MWLDLVKQARGGEEPIELNWKPFSLDQVNQKVGEDYKVWSEPEENIPDRVWGLRAGVGRRTAGRRRAAALHAAAAGRRGTTGARTSADMAVLTRVAGEAGLDVERFERDVRDRSSLEEVAASHEAAVEEHGVFGTPTFVFENGTSTFLKLIRPDTPEQADAAFDHVLGLMEANAYVGEIKRPQPPWPKGVFGR